MRLPPSLLTASERTLFAPWLGSAIAASGKSKSEFASAVGDGSTERLNRILNGGCIPSKPLLRKIAQAAGVPFVVACLRAGYLDELVEPIGILYFWAFETNERRYAAAAMLAAFHVFPAPGKRFTRGGFDRAMTALETVLTSTSEPAQQGRFKPPRRLPGVFGAIVRVLREAHLPAGDRRDVTSLLFRSLAYRLDADIARAVEADSFPTEAASSKSAFQQALREVAAAFGLH